MSPESHRLLELLAPGTTLSGQQLAEQLAVSRSAVWKQVRALRRLGLEIHGRAGRGYRLAWPVSLIDEIGLRDALGQHGIRAELYPALDSTNAALSRLPDSHRRAVLAEYQSAGRGRRGRAWLSPPAAGIYLSFGYRFDCGLPRLGPLSLVSGLAAADALEQATGPGVGLKWPNDLMLEGRKLGGLLVEISGAADGPCLAVIGLGVNVRLPQARQPDQPWIDLHGAGLRNPDRTALAIDLVRGLDRACATFGCDGFGHFEADWKRRDILAGRPVRVEQIDGAAAQGIARGVSERGGLLLESNDGLHEFSAGEVSVRAE